MEKKEYKLSTGASCYQTPLTVRKDYQILKLIFGLETGNLQSTLESFTLLDLLNLLLKENIIEKFLGVILTPVGQPFSDGDLDVTNTELEEILADFFTLNPELQRMWSSLSKTRAISMMNTMLSSSGRNAKTSPQNLSKDTMN